MVVTNTPSITAPNFKFCPIIACYCPALLCYSRFLMRKKYPTCQNEAVPYYSCPQAPKESVNEKSLSRYKYQQKNALPPKPTSLLIMCFPPVSTSITCNYNSLNFLFSTHCLFFRAFFVTRLQKKKEWDQINRLLSEITLSNRIRTRCYAYKFAAACPHSVTATRLQALTGLNLPRSLAISRLLNCITKVST